MLNYIKNNDLKITMGSKYPISTEGILNDRFKKEQIIQIWAATSFHTTFVKVYKEIVSTIISCPLTELPKLRLEANEIYYKFIDHRLKGAITGTGPLGTQELNMDDFSDETVDVVDEFIRQMLTLPASKLVGLNTQLNQVPARYHKRFSVIINARLRGIVRKYAIEEVDTEAGMAAVVHEIVAIVPEAGV